VTITRNMLASVIVSDLEYSDPSEADVVERYSAEERVIADRSTRAVVLMPVDAASVQCRRRRRVSQVPPRHVDVRR